MQILCFSKIKLLIMKKIVLLLITFLLLTSCGIIKKITGSKTEKEVVKLPDKVEETKKEPEKNETSVSKPEESTNDIIIKEFYKNDIPSEIKYSGNIITGKRWTDKNGENIILLTKTEPERVKAKQPDFEDYVWESELFAYQFVKSNDTYTQLWKINDFIKDCPFDLTLDFIPNSLSITDLDKNGIAESTLLYKMACRSDVSPSDLKLIMHEGENKYALRGTMLVNEQGFKSGGDYKIDKSFESAPSSFLEYAKKQWNEYKREKFE